MPGKGRIVGTPLSDASLFLVCALVSGVEGKVLDGKLPLGEGLSGGLAARVHPHLGIKVGQVTLDGRL